MLQQIQNIPPVPPHGALSPLDMREPERSARATEPAELFEVRLLKPPEIGTSALGYPLANDAGDTIR